MESLDEAIRRNILSCCMRIIRLLGETLGSRLAISLAAGKFTGASVMNWRSIHDALAN
jgi:hypothetical protein